MSSVTRFYYDPFAEFDRLFDDAFSARFLPSSAATDTSSDRQALVRPRMDLYENKDTNTVTAAFELPGLKSEDVSIEVHQNRLVVSGEFNTTESREESGYAVRERRQGKFSRTLQLPSGVKHEDVRAKMENGLLTVTFPKDSPEQKPRHITVS
ncbi:small heat shock protein [Pisolithus albus]|nr:small heat shock protein [Pisolithus albus]